MTLLSKSLPYHYGQDRCLTGLEIMMNQGWPSTISHENMTLRVDGWPSELRSNKSKTVVDVVGQPDDDRPVKKSRKVARNGYHGTAFTDIAGNGMNLADLAVVLKSVAVSIRSDMWEFDPAHDFSEFVSEFGLCSIEIDPNSSRANRRTIARELGAEDEENLRNSGLPREQQRDSANDESVEFGQSD